MRRQTLTKPLTHLLGLNQDLRPACQASIVTLSYQLQPERFTRETHPEHNVSAPLQTVILLLPTHKAISALGNPCRNNTSKRTRIHTSKRCAITKPFTGRLQIHQTDHYGRSATTTDEVHLAWCASWSANFLDLKLAPLSEIISFTATPTEQNHKRARSKNVQRTRIACQRFRCLMLQHTRRGYGRLLLHVGSCNPV